MKNATERTPERQAGHTPGPWEARYVTGAGWEIRAVLPVGFKFDASHREADGTISFQTWVLHERKEISISSERWVQFETEQWTAMQKDNARLIAACPDLLWVVQRFLREVDDEITIGCIEDAREALAKAVAHE